jgi:hypothetical protein
LPPAALEARTKIVPGHNSFLIRTENKYGVTVY